MEIGAKIDDLPIVQKLGLSIAIYVKLADGISCSSRELGLSENMVYSQ